MVLLRAFLILLVLAMTPVHAASAAGMPLSGAAMAVEMTVVMTSEAMADCCEDGSHRTPACQMLTDLRDPPRLNAPLRSARLLRPRPEAARLTGRAPHPALPPPLRV